MLSSHENISCRESQFKAVQSRMICDNLQLKVLKSLVT